MDIERIEELIKILQSSTAEEISVRKGGFEVLIRKGAGRAVRCHRAATTAAPPAQSSTQSEPDLAESYVRAPMVGIFHRVDGMPSVGARVSRGDVIGTIESMKLLNDVVSDAEGIVAEVLVEDGTPVEYGQPLCRIEPDRDRG